MRRSQTSKFIISNALDRGQLRDWTEYHANKQTYHQINLLLGQSSYRQPIYYLGC